MPNLSKQKYPLRGGYYRITRQAYVIEALGDTVSEFMALFAKYFRSTEIE